MHDTLTAPTSVRNTHCLVMEFVVRTKHRWAQVAEKYGLSLGQLHTLGLLQAGQDVKMNDICSQLHCDASNVTGIVDRLVQQGLVERRENPQDRRAKVLSLTTRGHAIREESFAAIAEVDNGLLSVLTREEMLQLQRILTKLASAR